MIITSIFLFSTLFIFTSFANVAASPDEATLLEQLFLDLTIDEVVNRLHGLTVNEPWATEYVTAIRDKRFGDAIWARHHVTGDIQNGTFSQVNQTIFQAIEKDAIGYRTYYPEQYSDALAIYANTSNADTRTDILNLISNAKAETVSEMEKRVTYGIKCSADHLAYRSSCYRLLELMSQAKTYIGNTRRVYTYMSCNLRVGPYGSGTGDVTHHTAHLVARLIEEQCSRCPAHCDAVKVSGFSPRNSGHRKICLSSKEDGCF
ncbi:hypothetical protein FPHYL_10151 [Fusarium phyllophilum]|uniref:WD-like domain-containing protein n=1 Tax=Fusarium phyllophilum TaxID=47803 RepID=A0A8H5J334_9HYPO|nr:hypothetical protein FPHYL_10151 [Fusarium phyllophilum]